LVLNHHHYLGLKWGVKRFHYPERDRKLWKESGWTGIKQELIYSTSIHTMEEYNALPDHFSYAFLSPVFDSISKPGYKAERFNFSEKKESPVKVISLGGIRAGNVSEAIQMGFDGVALLGTIWNSENPVRSFMEVKSEVRKNIFTL
jgi:thiamine-phosphate pyrophosphorylase